MNSGAPLSAANSDSAERFNALQKVIRDRMPELDGLRGVAILTVLWHNGAWARHWEINGALAHLLNLFLNIGWVGVQLFFVLSGFLITGILLDEKGSPNFFRNFYARRVLRIFPLYYVTLLVLLVILPALGMQAAIDIRNQTHPIWYWLFLANWSIPTIGGPGALSHFWSLAVEEQFYLLWPFAIVVFSHKGLARLCLTLIASALLMRIVMINHGFDFAEWRAYEFTFARWDALACGALLALTLRVRVWHDWVHAIALPTVCATLCYIVIFIVVEHNYAPVEHGVAALNQTVAALLFAALIYLAIARERGAWPTFLRNSALRSVGKYSYAMYVFHYPLLIFFNIYFGEKAGSFELTYPILALLLRVTAIGAASYALAVCSWYVLEQPCLALKRHFVARRTVAVSGGGVMPN